MWDGAVIPDPVCNPPNRPSPISSFANRPVMLSHKQVMRFYIDRIFTRTRVHDTCRPHSVTPPRRHPSAHTRTCTCECFVGGRRRQKGGGHRVPAASIGAWQRGDDRTQRHSHTQIRLNAYSVHTITYNILRSGGDGYVVCAGEYYKCSPDMYV